MSQNQQNNQHQPATLVTQATTGQVQRIFNNDEDRMAFDAEVARFKQAPPITTGRNNSERNNRMIEVSNIEKAFMVDQGVTESKNCDSHGVYVATVIRTLGSTRIYTSCPDCVAVKKQSNIDEAKAKKLTERNERMARLVGNAGIPKFFAKKTLGAFIPATEQQNAIKLKFADFAANVGSEDFGSFLIAYGSTGTGKTHLSIATAIDAVSKNNTVLYMLASDVIRSLRNTWVQGSAKTETEVLHQLATVDLLVIDEIGVQFGTESEQNHLFEVINSRILEVKPTILVSNLLLNSPDSNVKTLRKYLGERVYDRMREVGESVCFDWQSHRGIKQ